MNDDKLNYIAILTDRDFGLEPKPFDHPRIRLGARGIVLNDKGLIAILNKSAKHEFKLVGGGIEEDENPELAFKREVLEEAGCEVSIDYSLGAIREEKSQDNFIQNSYLFVAHVTKDTGELHLTQKEIDEGSRLLWMPLDEAIQTIKDSEDKLQSSKYESLYHTRFIVRRDYTILNYYKSHQKIAA